MPEDDSYRLGALLQRHVNLDGVEITPSAYLVGTVQEIFQKYHGGIAEQDFETIAQEFTNEVCDDLAIPRHNESRLLFRMLLLASLGSMNLKAVLK